MKYINFHKYGFNASAFMSKHLKFMFKKVICLIILVAFSLCNLVQQLSAQDANYSFGLRGGSTSGLTVRQYLNENTGLEGILSFQQKSFKVTFLKEKFTESNIIFSNHFYFVKGLGGHAGYMNTDHYTFMWHTYYREEGPISVPIIGMDALAGFEYRMVIFPLIFGLDWKPYFEFSSFQIFNMNIWDIGFYAKLSLK